jgi:hypothetical protein
MERIVPLQKEIVKMPSMSKSEREQRRAAKSALVAGESKSDKSVRLARARMSGLLKSAELLGRLAGSGYQFSPEQVEKMKQVASERLYLEFAKFDRVRSEKTEPEFDF